MGWGHVGGGLMARGVCEIVNRNYKNERRNSV